MKEWQWGVRIVREYLEYDLEGKPVPVDETAELIVERSEMGARERFLNCAYAIKHFPQPRYLRLKSVTLVRRPIGSWEDVQ